jgi:2-keto-4-pentenoate hydratase
MSSKKSGKKSKVVSEAKAAKATEPKMGKAKREKPATAVPTKPATPRKVSALDAAAQVLQRKGEPMRSGELISAMAESGLWESPKGKTPHATLYAAILREISVKGRDARFRKVDRGRFEYAKGA